MPEPGLPPLSDGRRVAGMFGRVAGYYDLLNHLLSAGLDIVWRKRMVASLLAPGLPAGPILDLAAGTLDVSLAIAGQSDRPILAADFCLPMLAKGLTKIPPTTRGRIQPAQADGLALPVRTASTAGATIAFGIRNIRPRRAAFAELLRVLKPGGRLVVLEFGTGKRRIWGGLYNFYLTRLLPAIGKAVSGDSEAYRYLAQTIREFPEENALAEEMRAAGFTAVTHRAMTAGIVFLHVGRKGA